MRMRRISAAIVMTACLLQAQPALAVFTHLSVETYQVTVGGVERTQHRLWANFTSPTEGIASWGAIGTNLTIQNIQSNGQLSANGFLNAGGNGDLPPPSPPPHPDAIYDSYYTIYTTSLASFLGNFNMPAITDGAVTLSAAENTSFVTGPTPDDPWAYAGWWGSPPRALLMQALVTSGEHIRGTIGINTIGSEAVIVATFNSVPGPSALMVLAIAAVRSARRRR